MRLRWTIPIIILLSLRLIASAQIAGRIETITINPSTVTVLHLRPGFVSTIRMPEEINSVALGNRTEFMADHSEGEPLYVYVKPITNTPAVSNLEIVTRSGQHVSLELVSSGAGSADPPTPVDFLIEYRARRSFIVASTDSDASPPEEQEQETASPSGSLHRGPERDVSHDSSLDLEFDQEMHINAPKWTHWEGMQIETYVGDIRQFGDEVVVAYSIYNNSSTPVEIVPPQVQITGRASKKNHKNDKDVISDQLEIREYRLSATRLEPRQRVDGVVLFDRPNFKQSTEKLYLQLAQADKIDRPVLIPIPFTPPIAEYHAQE